jgi:hypothetical protein
MNYLIFGCHTALQCICFKELQKPDDVVDVDKSAYYDHENTDMNVEKDKKSTLLSKGRVIDRNTDQLKDVVVMECDDTASNTRSQYAAKKVPCFDPSVRKVADIINGKIMECSRPDAIS